MKIDVEPKLIQDNSYWNGIIELRGIKALYFFELANGDRQTVMFDGKSLDEFQPNRTVSEMISIWEDNFVRLLEEATTALKTGLHPERKKMVGTNQFTRKWGEEVEIMVESDEPDELDDYDIAYFKSVIKRVGPKLGSISFLKISPWTNN